MDVRLLVLLREVSGWQPPPGVDPDEPETAAALRARARDRHQPVRTLWGLACGGCDLGGPAGKPTDWPCSTAEIVYTDTEIKELKEST